MKNKVIVITGASSGIGKATALQFAKEGSKIIIAARTLDKLDETKQEIINLGAEVFSIKADVAIEEDCKRLIDQTIVHFGKIDVLINNAGISMRALFNETDLSVIKNVMDVNFWGTVYCTKYALPSILENKGSVVGVSSIAGFVGLPARTGYSASKFAMHGFLNALRNENLENDLHVLIACPGFTASNIRNTALKADGSKQGESPREEEKMMSANEVSEHIYSAVVHRKEQIVLSSEGKLAHLLSKFMPKTINKAIFYKLKKEPNSPIK
ncbi:MAG: SDR family oxidoreductase [Bacteroidetes bacterium]|nr:SDR family oxidoreductase [Bacteroidota bacterium]MCB0803862.1 SDR family oxidoreductase [Flavobacteriales bacterium]NOG57168.1 SDR family oxidoreductase [Bacteroidota bacterium]